MFLSVQTLAIITYAALVFVLSGCSVPSDPQRREVSIVKDASDRGDSAFSPNPVIVPFGGQVVWLNDDVMEHSIVGDAKRGPCVFQSNPIVHGKRFQKSFFKRITCNYYCGIHGRTMRGKIIIE